MSDENQIPEQLTKFAGEDGAIDTSKLGESYIQLEREMGSRVKIPDMEDAEAVGKFYDKLGRPESPDKYEIEPVEGLDVSDSVLSAVRAAAHAKGLNGTQFKAVAGSYLEAMKAAQAEQQQAIEQQNADRWAELKKEWGEDTTKENIELAKRAVRDSELKDLLDDAAVEKDPILVKFVSNLMRKAGDDKLITGDQTDDKDFVPVHLNSPEMYANGEDEYSKKARAYFAARGHKY